MSIVAHTRPFVIGVDTHARKHSYAILTAVTGGLEICGRLRPYPSESGGRTPFVNYRKRPQ